MKSLGWLTGCALAIACAHEGKSVAGDSDTKMQGAVAGDAVWARLNAAVRTRNAAQKSERGCRE